MTRLLRKAGVRRLDAGRGHPRLARPPRRAAATCCARFPVGALLDGGDGTARPRLPGARARGRRPRRAPRPGARAAPLELARGDLVIDVLSPPPRPPGPAPEDPNPRAVVAVVRSGAFEPAAVRRRRERGAAAARPARRGRDEGAAPRQRRPGPAGGARPPAPGARRDRGGRDNTYGHPAPSTLAALRRAGVPAYRTDRDGTVTLTVRGHRRGSAHASAEAGRPEPCLHCDRGRSEARLPRLRRRRREDRRLAPPPPPARRGRARPRRARDVRRPCRASPARWSRRSPASPSTRARATCSWTTRGPGRRGSSAPLEAALADVPPDTVLVLLVRGKPLKALRDAVEKAGGDVRDCAAPKPWELPKWAVERGRELGPAARQGGRQGARVTRVGPEPAAALARAREAGDRAPSRRERRRGGRGARSPPATPPRRPTTWPTPSWPATCAPRSRSPRS